MNNCTPGLQAAVEIRSHADDPRSLGQLPQYPELPFKPIRDTVCHVLELRHLDYGRFHYQEQQHLDTEGGNHDQSDNFWCSGELKHG